MTDTFGLRRLRNKYSDATKEVVDHMQELHRLVVKAETMAADKKDELENENIVFEKAVQIRNDFDALINDLDVKRSKATEAAEFAIDAYIDAARLKRQFMEFKKHYDSSVSMTLALMSIPYIMSMVLENEETIDRTLNQIGLDRVSDWIDRRQAPDTKELENE